LIKLVDILKEIAGDASGVWYHGSTADVDQADLDPLFRQNKGKEFMSSKAAGEGSTGSQGGAGIYFGKDKTCIDSFCPMNYTGFASEYAKQGFMYEMKLKPEAKVEKKSDLHNISADALNKFKQLDYLKKELGDYKLVKIGDKQLYQPIDDNIDKSFQYSTDRKWFNV